MRNIRRIEVVRTAVGIKVRGSTQSDHSVTLRQEAQPFGVEGEVEGLKLDAGSFGCFPAPGLSSESFSGGHGMMTHTIKCGRRPGYMFGRSVPFQHLKNVGVGALLGVVIENNELMESLGTCGVSVTMSAAIR